MAEIVGAFLRADLWDEGANSSIEGRNSSGGELAQERLEFAVRHLNRIKIRGVLWKVADYRPRFLNRLPNAGPRVDSAVIHHHDVVAPERGDQALLDICEEHLSGHGTLDHHRRRHLLCRKVATQVIVSHAPTGTVPISLMDAEPVPSAAPLCSSASAAR